MTERLGVAKYRKAMTLRAHPEKIICRPLLGNHPPMNSQPYPLLKMGIIWALICSSGLGCGARSVPQSGESGQPAEAASEPIDQSSTVTDTRPAHAEDWFEDMTAQSGVDFAYRNGREGKLFTVLETVGGGVAAFDYDQDGDIDLFILGGGTITGPPLKTAGLPSRLYRNDGDWKFTDVTEQAGLGEPGDYSLGCAVGDFDRDGYPDLFVTCHGRSRLYRNTGAGSFTDVTQTMGLSIDGLSTGAVWADVNRDGWPDLFVAGYLQIDADDDQSCGDTLRKIRDVCGPRLYPAAQDRLFLNRMGKGFEEVTQQAGIGNQGKGLGVLAADINEDGWIDIYVANDTTNNELYLGGPDFPFLETAMIAGVATDANGTPQGSMGIDFGDYDGDGKGDLWVTNFERESNTLYRSVGNGVFTDATLSAQLASLSRPQVSFGTGLVDFDSDGWLDLYVLNGHVAYFTGQSPYLQRPLLLRNQQGRSFADVSDIAGAYFGLSHAGRGAASADLDNDGAIDLVLVHQNAPVVLLRNRQTPANWIRVELRGTTSDLDAVGAVASMDYQGRRLIRAVVGGAGYLSCSDRRIVFPTEDDRPRDIKVRWLGGKEEVFRSVPVRTNMQLVEGTGEDVR